MSSKQVRSAFKAWCARNGFSAQSRRVSVLDPIGSAFLRCKKGRFSVELATPLDPSQKTLIELGRTHGYSYPMLEESLEQALIFLQS